VAEEVAGPWFCYMLRCADRSFYIGVATDVGERIKEHNWGCGAAFTAKRRPVGLVWQQRFENQRDAREGERELKGRRREKKLRLIREFQRAAGGYGDS
jgi:putative endonuclease